MTGGAVEHPRQLFPVPRVVDTWRPERRFDGSPAFTDDPSLPAEGFALTIDEAGIVCRHADANGRRYGERLLAQLRADDGSYPEVALRDWPAIAVRGFMLDVSRNRVPTRATLAWLVEMLVAARYNHLQLYVEHTVAYRDHPTVWAAASPLTHDDLRWLDDHCHDHGIELAANQNCFGHLAQWLRHDEYRWRAECPEGLAISSALTMPPSVLEPTAANAEFAVALAVEQLSCLRSRRVNIGCDETFELGRGASRERADAVGVGRVYLDHVSRLAAPLLADGCAVQIWADVLAHHPELIAELPTGDLTPVVWSYDAPGAAAVELPDGLRRMLAGIGLDLETARSFGELVAPFAERPVWLAAGTSSWLSLVGRLDNAAANLADAVATAVATDAPGMLVCAWGDGGHLQPLIVSAAPLALGGAGMWTGAAELEPEVGDPVVDDLVAATDHVAGLAVGRALLTLGGLAEQTGVQTRNCSPLAAALTPKEFMLRWGEPDADAVGSVIDAIDDAVSTLTGDDPRVGELRVAAALARHGARRLAAAADGGPRFDDDERVGELRTLVEEVRAAWLTSSRPGGLDASLRLLAGDAFEV